MKVKLYGEEGGPFTSGKTYVAVEDYRRLEALVVQIRDLLHSEKHIIDIVTKVDDLLFEVGK
jgi:hypothetical protein